MIPVFVSGTWILGSNCWWDPGFLDLYSGFQSPGRIRDSTSKNFANSGIRIPLQGRYTHDNTYFSLRAKCWLRGGVGRQFLSNLN